MKNLKRISLILLLVSGVELSLGLQTNSSFSQTTDTQKNTIENQGMIGENHQMCENHENHQMCENHENHQMYENHENHQMCENHENHQMCENHENHHNNQQPQPKN